MILQSRDRLFAVVWVLNSENVSRRLHNLQWHWDEYITSDFNFLWSIDDHCKLKNWEIEIYAAIDVYFRKIIWIYIEITSHTAVSILRQYIDTLQDEQIHLFHIRSDRGIETSFIATAHHEFMKKHEMNIALKNCYWYEISIKNVRIESWWDQLTESQLFAWRVSIIFY